MPPIPSCITSPFPDYTHVSYPLRFIRHQFRPSRSVFYNHAKTWAFSRPCLRFSPASAVWFTRSEHAFGIFLTRCFLKSPDQSDLSLTALRHLRCLIELSETREKSTVYWTLLVTYCYCFNYCIMSKKAHWCSVGDYLLCVFVVCAFMVMFCCFVVDVL